MPIASTSNAAAFTRRTTESDMLSPAPPRLAYPFAELRDLVGAEIRIRQTKQRRHGGIRRAIEEGAHHLVQRLVRGPVGADRRQIHVARPILLVGDELFL